MLKAMCASGIGMRPTHEDNFLINGKIIENDIQQKMSEVKLIQYQSVCNKKVNFIAVSDGMGGHNAGEVASHYCVAKLASLEKRVQNCASLDEVISSIQREISGINMSLCEKAHQCQEQRGMGSTLVLLINFEHECAIMNIGDSRAYCLNGQRLQQISIDHTEGQRMIDLGILTRKEVNSFPAKKNLNRYFGYDAAGFHLLADVFHVPDCCNFFLLCSDGVSDAFDEKKLSEYIIGSTEPLKITERIVRDACCLPHADNATAIIVESR